METKIGPVLEVKVCYHQGRYGVEIKIEPLFRDGTCSWDRIVNGKRNVRRDSCGKSWREEYRATCCEGWTTTDTDRDVVSCVYSENERKWIDIGPGIFNQGCFGVSKLMIRLLRHDESVH